jgi:hypothetical protein
MATSPQHYHGLPVWPYRPLLFYPDAGPRNPLVSGR